MDLWLPPSNDLRSIVDDYSDAKHERKPHGIIIVDGKEVATTLQCPHCAAHFVSRKGSGTRRAFCMKCMAVTCGALSCDPCRPFDSGQLSTREL